MRPQRSDAHSLNVNGGGANPTTEPDTHWFLGDGMVNGVRLEKGRASWYRNRWVKTAALGTGLRAEGKIDPTTGQLHFYGTGFAPPFLTYHVANPDGTLVHSTEITPGVRGTMW